MKTKGSKLLIVLLSIYFVAFKQGVIASQIDTSSIQDNLMIDDSIKDLKNPLQKCANTVSTATYYWRKLMIYFHGTPSKPMQMVMPSVVEIVEEIKETPQLSRAFEDLFNIDPTYNLLCSIMQSPLDNALLHSVAPLWASLRRGTLQAISPMIKTSARASTSISWPSTTIATSDLIIASWPQLSLIPNHPSKPIPLMQNYTLEHLCWLDFLPAMKIWETLDKRSNAMMQMHHIDKAATHKLFDDLLIDAKPYIQLIKLSLGRYGLILISPIFKKKHIPYSKKVMKNWLSWNFNETLDQVDSHPLASNIATIKPIQIKSPSVLDHAILDPDLQSTHNLQMQTLQWQMWGFAKQMHKQEIIYEASNIQNVWQQTMQTWRTLTHAQLKMLEPSYTNFFPSANPLASHQKPSGYSGLELFWLLKQLEPMLTKQHPNILSNEQTNELDFMHQFFINDWTTSIMPCGNKECSLSDYCKVCEKIMHDAHLESLAQLVPNLNKGAEYLYNPKLYSNKLASLLTPYFF